MGKIQKANKKHDKNIIVLRQKFDLKDDVDILKHLVSIENVQIYIKELIRKDITKATN